MRRYTGKKPGGIRRCVFGVTAFTVLLAMFSIVDGISRGILGFRTGCWLLVAGVALFAVLTFLAGALTAGGDR